MPANIGSIHVRVPGGTQSEYEVRFGAGSLDELPHLLAQRSGMAPSRVLLVHDAALPVQTLQLATAPLAAAGITPVSHPLVATETDKSLAAFQGLLEAMTTLRIDRSEVIVALGGGIVGDLAGFAASVYRRGVAIVQCPTTLLAMVDASVGGKTAVNLTVSDAGSTTTLKKNMVGSFHQPIAVIADTRTLLTLAPRDLRAGLAECVKHAMISGDASDVAALNGSIDRITSLDLDALSVLIGRNVAIKARFVESDVFETAPDDAGGRALLNLGHTFGHALETQANLHPENAPGPLRHGEAISLGLVAASTTAAAIGMIEQAHLNNIRSLLSRIGLPVQVRNVPEDARMLELMSHDKKVMTGDLRLILPCGPGLARVVRNPPVEAICAGLAAIRLRQTG